MNNDKLITFLTTSALVIYIVNLDVNSHNCSVKKIEDSEFICSFKSYDFKDSMDQSVINSKLLVENDKTDYVYNMPKVGSFKAKISKNNLIHKDWL